MNRFRHYLAGGIGVALLAFVLALTPSGPVTAESPKPVEVVNSPIVQAQQSGSWNVGINGPVRINNAAMDPIPVRDVEHPTRQAFQQVLNCTLTTGFVCSSSFSVPPGKLLVIETISARAQGPPGDRLRLAFTNHAFDEYVIPLQFQVSDPAGSQRFHALHNLRVYVHPGDAVTLFFNRATPGPDSAFATMTFSGHLVDCGSGAGCPIP